MSQTLINNCTNCGNTTNSYNTKVYHNCIFADQLSPLLKWLSPLDPGLRHSDLQERRVNDVGEWFLSTRAFRTWCGLGGEGQGDKAILFCYGNPGVGKTFMSSLVVDKLCDQTKGQNTVTTCFYFDFAARKEQTATCMLGSLLKQVISGMEWVPEEISGALQDQKKAVCGRKPQLSDIVGMLQRITSSQPTFMVIDALDECTAVQRFRLFDSLEAILAKSPGARIFVTGRPHIRTEIETRLKGRVTSVSVGPSRDDIVRLLRVRLSEDETPEAMDSSLEADILEKIPQSTSEMLLLASLNIETILQESTIYRRRERLGRMTNGLGLGGVYGETIERIKAQGGDKSRLGVEALMWTSHAERPLGADELCHALAIELGSTDFNSDNIPSIATLVSCCQGLITVDGRESTVRLIHFTLKEYLSAHPDIFGKMPDSKMAEVCLTYLNSPQVKALSSNPPRDIWEIPYISYYSVYWGIHAKRGLSDCAMSLALKLFRGYDGHISTPFLLSEVPYLELEYEWDRMFSGLHCASLFGIVELVGALIEMGCYDLNKGGVLGYTPLIWAARYGHEEVVRLLLGRQEVNPNALDDESRSPLFFAAREGHEGVVKILLEREDINPDELDDNRRTPLFAAIQGGSEAVVKMLLGREGVNPARLDNKSVTPLSDAAWFGHVGMVKLLLGQEGVDPDSPCDDRRTPLSLAAQLGHEEVVKILLEQDEVNPDNPDHAYRTPLSFAAQCGHDGVVKILLGRSDVDPNKPNFYGETSLLHAAEGGHEGIVKMLLERNEVNPDKRDMEGRTPLSCAAQRGHKGVVKMLLERHEVNPDKPDQEGKTPLLLAAGGGSAELVRMLLKRDSVNPNMPDKKGRTPLSCAARRGYEGVVRALLERDDIDPDKPDNKGQTPLLRAAKRGQEGVVKILLKREDVNPNKPDNGMFRTPIKWAAWNGHPRVVALLHPYKAVTRRAV